MVWIDQEEEIPEIRLPDAPGCPGFTRPAHTLDHTFLDEQRRCSTWMEAEAQHQAVIDELREPGDDVEQLFPEAMTVQPVTLPRSAE